MGEERDYSEAQAFKRQYNAGGGGPRARGHCSDPMFRRWLRQPMGSDVVRTLTSPVGSTAGTWKVAVIPKKKEDE